MRSFFLGFLVPMIALAGCASTPSGRALSVDSVASLSGNWLGYATGTAAGSPNPVELTINPDGTWTSRTGAQVQNGTVTINAGKITFTRRGASAGSATVFSSSTAVLQERGGKRVLVGQGRSDYGPFTYEFTEQK
jgi:hypothetical protein